MISVSTTRRAHRGMVREWRLHALSIFSLAVAPTLALTLAAGCRFGLRTITARDRARDFFDFATVSLRPHSTASAPPGSDARFLHAAKRANSEQSCGEDRGNGAIP